MRPSPRPSAAARPPVIRCLAPGLVLALALGLLPPAPAAAETRDPKAVEIAERLYQTVGGPSWETAPIVRFTFAGFRTHTWEKATGRHRLEGKTREGDSYVVLSNLETREGAAWKNGEKVEGEELGKLLELAYGAWINDVYWLAFPMKLLDPGVNLTYDGEETLDGMVYDKLKLTFEGVGLTPGDTYWASVNRETGLLDRWAYVLESYEEGQAATHWKWGGWADYHGVKLASERVRAEDGRELPLGDIAVLDSLPEGAFTSPEPVAAP